MSLEYGETFENINREIRKTMDIVGEEQENKILKACGDAIKKKVIENMPEKSEISHTHMRDDVKVKVRYGRDVGKYVSIGGGKETGYKWHFLSDGYTDPAGRWHSGNGFVEKAVNQAESDIGSILDRAVSEAAK